MKKRVLTIHRGNIISNRYGFEKTHLRRKEIINNINLKYIQLLTYPQIRKEWKKKIKEQGFSDHEIWCVPHSYSNIGHSSLTTTIDKLVGFHEKDIIETNDEGYVVSVELFSGEGKYYFTDGIFLFEDYKNNEIRWYNKNGKVALIGREFNPLKEPVPHKINYKGFLYKLGNKILNEDELLIDYLSKNTYKSDVLIRDLRINSSPELWRFIENNGRTMYDYIHMDVLSNGELVLLRRKSNFLVASEVLTNILKAEGFQVQFLPPVYVNTKVEKKNITGPITDYCFVGNMADVKRPEIIIETFKVLYQKTLNLQVTFYGGNKDRIEFLKNKYHPTPNIIFKGVVDEVPYEKHQCYLSSSYSELFANACIEAMSYGLLAVVSNVNIGHRYYASKSNNVILFNNKEDLIRILTYLSKTNFSISNKDNLDMLDKYSLNNVAKLYKNILD